MGGLFSILFFVSFTVFIVGLCKPEIISRFTKQVYTRKKVLSHFGIATIVLFVLAGAMVDGNTSKNPSVSPSNPQVAQTKEGSDVKDAPTSTIRTVATQERIREIVAGIGGLFAVTYDKDGKMVADTSENPPYAITINTSASDIKDCFDAKNKLFELAKRLYTDPAVGSKISRVKFTAWKQLRASIGSEDVKELKWPDLAPTNFWRTTLQYKGYEDETGDLAKRTWGVTINPECK